MYRQEEGRRSKLVLVSLLLVAAALLVFPFCREEIFSKLSAAPEAEANTLADLAGKFGRDPRDQTREEALHE